jgi:hypothetical protein
MVLLMIVAPVRSNAFFKALEEAGQHMALLGLMKMSFLKSFLAKFEAKPKAFHRFMHEKPQAVHLASYRVKWWLEAMMNRNHMPDYILG